MSKDTHKFSAKNCYMFGFTFNGDEPDEVIVEKPHRIEDNRMFFIILYGYKSINEDRSFDEIVAVGDHENGTVSVLGWAGKYTILNQELFDSLLKSGALQLTE